MNRAWNPFEDSQQGDPFEAGKNLAAYVAGYYLELVDRGIPAALAGDLASRWVLGLIGRAEEKPQ